MSAHEFAVAELVESQDLAVTTLAGRASPALMPKDHDFVIARGDYA